MVVGELVVHWRRNPLIRRLTKEIVELEQGASQTFVDFCLRIGERLAAAREVVEHGDWIDWVANELPYTPETARNYVALLEWSRQHRREFDTFRHLSATKLYQIVRLEAPKRLMLKVDKAFPIPGTSKKLTLDRMTVEELRRVINSFAPRPDSLPPLSTLLRSYKNHVAALNDLIDTLATHPDRIPRAEARELRTQLLQTARELGAKLGL